MDNMRALIRGFALCLFLAFGVGVAQFVVVSPAVAQQEQPRVVDYTAWKSFALRVEAAIEARTETDGNFDVMRQQLVAWRMNFQIAGSTNRGAIQTAKAQLSALGAKPEDGSESEALAAERASVTERLAELEAPVRTAEAAFTRADGLIAEIDRIIRERQAVELIEYGPSPLNPAHWSDGYTAVAGTLQGLVSETVEAWNSPRQQSEFRTNLPFAILLGLAAFVLLMRGRKWISRLGIYVQSGTPTAAKWLAGFALSLGQIVLPLAGILALVKTIHLTGMIGPRADNLLGALAPLAFGVLSALWLGVRIFPKGDAFDPPLNLGPDHRREGRLYAGLLGLAIASFWLISFASEFDDWPGTANVVVLLPSLIIAGLLMLRLSWLLAHHVRNDTQPDTPRSYSNRLIMTVSRILAVVAIAGPTLAALGYYKAAHFVIFPTAMSLQLLAFLVILQRLATEFYVLLTDDREGITDSLTLVLISFGLVLLSAPVFALIWGARLSDLAELWTTFTQGFTLGDTRISPVVFLSFMMVFVLGYLLTRLLQGVLKNTILPKTKMDIGGRNAITSGVGYVGILLAALVAINSAGIDLSSLAIVAGALSVGIGFGLQNIVSNFVSGIILLIERPISQGDWIEVGGQTGYVRDISVRSTRIETFDRTDVIVPNADLVSGTVTNYTRGNTVGRAIVPVGVAYGTDTKRVEAILREIAEAHPMVLMNPPPGVLFVGFGASSLDFEIRAILRDVNWMMPVKSDLNHAIAKRFGEEKIEIPFAQSDVWLRNPEALREVKE